MGRPGESSTPTAELPGLADVVKQEGQQPGISSNAPNCYTNGDLGIEGSLAPPEVEARRRPLFLRVSCTIVSTCLQHCHHPVMSLPAPPQARRRSIATGPCPRLLSYTCIGYVVSGPKNNSIHYKEAVVAVTTRGGSAQWDAAGWLALARRHRRRQQRGRLESTRATASRGARARRAVP